jgi:hypothetical protein
MLPLAMLAHVGEPGEAEGRRVGWVSCHVGGPAGWPATPWLGEARWQGPRQVDRAASLFPAPTPARGGGGRGLKKRRVGGKGTSHDEG